MNSQYPALLSANWVRTAYYLPRWFDINAVPDLTDDIELPVEGTAVDPVPETGEYTDVPALWSLATTDLSVNPSVLAAVLESFGSELELSRIATLQVEHAIGATPETTQPGHLWIVPTNTTTVSGFRPTSVVASLVEVKLSDGSFVEVVEATSFNSLLYSGQWGWFYERPYLCIFGPGLTEAESVEASGWSFIYDQTIWDRGSLVFVQQPTTDRWIPLYPDEIRDDGMLGVKDGPYQVRTTRPNSHRSLPQINVRLNGTMVVAERALIANSVDQCLTVVGLLRKETDYLWELKSRVAAYHAVTQNQSRSSVQARLAIAFGNYTSATLASGLLTATAYPTGYNFAFVPEVPTFDIWAESLIPTSGAVAFLTTVASADCWQAFENNTAQSMAVSAYFCSFDYNIDLVLDRPQVTWLVTNYRNSGGSFRPTRNFPSTRELQIIYTKDVLVPDPSIDSKDEATKLSYLVRWKSQAISQDLEIHDLPGHALFI